MSDYLKGKYDGYVECLVFILCGYGSEELKELIKERMRDIKDYDRDRNE